RARDGIGIQGHSAISRQHSAEYVGPGSHCDGRKSQDASLKGRAGTKRRRSADLPKDVISRRAIDQDHMAARYRGKGGANLEDEYGVRIALTVENHAPGYHQRRRGFVDAGKQGLPAYIARESS